MKQVMQERSLDNSLHLDIKNRKLRFLSIKYHRWMCYLTYQLNAWNIISLLTIFCILATMFAIFSYLPIDSVFKIEGASSAFYSQFITNSVVLVLGVGLFTSIMGIITAWLVSIYDFPLRRFLSVLLILPITIPSYILAYCYEGLLDYSGWLRNALAYVFSVELHQVPLPYLVGHGAAIFILSLALYVYIYITMRFSFQNQLSEILENARTLQPSLMVNFFKLSLPLSRPALLAGLSLVIMEILNDYGVADYYGIPTLTTGIFRSWFDWNNLQLSIQLSIILTLLILALICLESIQRKNKSYKNTHCRQRKLEPIKTSFLQGILFTFICSIPVVLGFILPITQLLYWTQFGISDYTFNHLSSLLFNTIWLSLYVAFISMVLSLVIEYTLQMKKGFLLLYVCKFINLGYSMPGAVIAIGIIILSLSWSSLDLPSWVNFFHYGSFSVLYVGLVIRFLAVAYNPIHSHFKQVSDRFIKTSFSLGFSPMQTLKNILIPMNKKNLFAIYTLVFIDILKELPLTLMLGPFNFSTLATHTHLLAADENLQESAFSSLAIILVGLIGIFILNGIQKSNKRQNKRS